MQNGNHYFTLCVFEGGTDSLIYTRNTSEECYKLFTHDGVLTSTNQLESEKNKVANSIKIAPNPFKNALRIQYQNSFIALQSLVIYNIAGERIFVEEGIPDQDKNNYSKQVMNNEANGWYMIQMTFSDGSIHHYPVVKTQ